MEYVIYFLLMLAAYLLAPRPKIPNASVQEGEVPTVSASAPIPVVFGTVDIKQSNVVWWGDTATTPIYAEGGKK